MAYVKKFDAYFNNHTLMIDSLSGNVVNYRIEILQLDGAAGSTEVLIMTDTPVTIKSVSSSRASDAIVVGSELVFSLITDSPATFTPIFESLYKDWRIDFYNDDTSTLIWRGFVQPENLQRTLYTPYTQIEISASDALKDLTNQEYDPDTLGEKESIITVLKHVLSPLDIPLDFVIKLGTHEARKSATDLALSNVYVDTRRFSREVNGTTETDSCLEVIEKMLRPFDVRLRQANGKYDIRCISETDSYEYAVNWSDLATASRTATDDIVEIATNHYERGAILSKIAPVKYLDVTRYNRNIGENLISDLDNFTGLDSPWDFTDLPYTYSEEGDTLKIEVVEPEAGIKTFLLTPVIEITTFNDADFFQLEFEHTFNNVIIDEGNVPVVNINVIIEKDQGVDDFQEYRRDNVAITINPAGEWFFWGTTFGEFAQIGATGTYRFKFEVFAQSTATSWSTDIFLRNFKVNKLSTVEGDQVSDLTFDSLHRYTSDLGKKREKKEIWIADSFGSGDLGRYIVMIGLDVLSTQYWNRYGVTDTETILNLWAQNYLNRRSQYRDHIEISVWDVTQKIKVNSKILDDNKYYEITSYENDYRRNRVRLFLEEVDRLTSS